MRPTITFITPNCHESSPPEGDRHVELRRQVRREVENAKRKSRDVCTRTGGLPRRVRKYDLSLGKSVFLPKVLPTSPDSGSPKNKERSVAFPRKIKIYKKSVKRLLTVSQIFCKIPLSRFRRAASVTGSQPTRLTPETGVHRCPAIPHQ